MKRTRSQSKKGEEASKESTQSNSKRGRRASINDKNIESNKSPNGSVSEPPKIADKGTLTRLLLLLIPSVFGLIRLDRLMSLLLLSYHFFY